MSDWRDQEVLNEVEARARNEWIESTTDSFGAPEQPMDAYACECGYLHCSSSIILTRGEYETVRRDGAHFVIAVNHENPEIDHLISENDRFAVVEKWSPSSRRIVLAADPRHAGLRDERSPYPRLPG